MSVLPCASVQVKVAAGDAMELEKPGRDPFVWAAVGRLARLLLSLRVLSRSARHLARRGNIYLLLQQALIVRLGRPTIFTNVM